MSEIDVQLFRENGTWIKPPGAVTVDVVLAGADAAGPGIDVTGGTYGMVTGHSLRADELPDEVAVTIGRRGRSGAVTVTYVGAGGGGIDSYAGGSGGGEYVSPHDGLAVIITHLGNLPASQHCPGCDGGAPSAPCPGGAEQ